MADKAIYIMVGVLLASIGFVVYETYGPRQDERELLFNTLAQPFMVVLHE